MFDLEALGWNSHFEEEFRPYREKGLEAGRVVLEHKGAYRIYAERGELLGEVTGRIRYEARGRGDFPAVGDWVVISPERKNGRCLIQTILPRRSKFSRKVAGKVTDEQIVATNIDTVFLITGLDNDFSLRRVERYLVVALESGASPVIILNKADLCPDVGRRVLEVEAIAVKTPVHAISSKMDQGLEVLDRYISRGETIAFLGSSGVGKSTLINKLVGRDVQKVQEVRESDDRGKHTTRHRELIVLPQGGLLIDTPGMRELQLWEVGEGLSDTFADIGGLAAGCHFSNCTHSTEPGCAVREALASGSLDRERYENYLKMRKELEYLESRQETRTQLERKERDKKINKAFNRMKPRR